MSKSNNQFTNPWTEEERDFIRKNYADFLGHTQEFTDLLNRTFKHNRSDQSVRSQASYLGIVKKNIVRYVITYPMIAWLEENEAKYATWKELTEDFNKHFNSNVSKSQIMDALKRLKIKKPLRHRDNLGRFKVGERFSNNNYHPIGSEAVFNGFVYVKVADYEGSMDNEIFKKNWKVKQRYLWENAHNDVVKKDEVVIFLDGDRNNFELDNLIKITRGENLQLNRMGAFGKGELTLTALDVIRCKKMIMDIERA